MALILRCDACINEVNLSTAGRQHYPRGWFAALSAEGEEVEACSIGCAVAINDRRKLEGRSSLGAHWFASGESEGVRHQVRDLLESERNAREKYADLGNADTAIRSKPRR